MRTNQSTGQLKPSVSLQALIAGYFYVIICFIFLNPIIAQSSECAGIGQGTIFIKDINPMPNQIFEKGKWITFSGTISYSLINSDTGIMLIVLFPSPSLDDNTVRYVPIKEIDLNQSNGTVNFDGEVQIDRSIEDGSTPFYSFSIGAILYHPDYSCSSIVDNTNSYQLSGDNYSCDLKDVINILNIATGMEPYCYRSYDFDHNGKVDISDVIGILQCVAKIR